MCFVYCQPSINIYPVEVRQIDQLATIVLVLSSELSLTVNEVKVKGKGKGKGIVHPKTGHETPEEG